MRIRDEAGFTIPELLVAMAMFVIILLATLTVFDQSSRVSSAHAKQNDSLEEARVTIDHVMRQLRNLASPVSPQSTIQTAGKYDLVFQTDDPSRTWVRYCLDQTGNGTKPQGTLYYGYTSAASLTSSQKSTCPGTGWPAGGLRVVASDVTNELNGQDRPVFTYACTAGSPPGCPASSTDNSKIVLASANLYIDTNPGAPPAEKQVTSSVYLRNQNEPPTASYSITPQPAPPRTFIFNGSASSDPEGRTLHFYWCDNSPAPCSMSSSGFIGTGVTLTYTFPGTTATPHTIVLTVVDPGGLLTNFTNSVTP